MRTRSSPLRRAGDVVLALFALALVFYGLMVVLLAAKVDPGSVQAISGYRSAYDFLSTLGPGDLDGSTRPVLVAAGLAAFVLFGWLAFKELPRPYLARHDIDLVDDDRGAVTVAPKAAERAAELAACHQAGVASAHARYATDELAISVTAGRARDLPDVLRAVHDAVAEAIRRHGLPETPVHVTLTGYERRTRRELN